MARYFSDKGIWAEGHRFVYDCNVWSFIGESQDGAGLSAPLTKNPQIFRWKVSINLIRESEQPLSIQPLRRQQNVTRLNP